MKAGEVKEVARSVIKVQDNRNNQLRMTTLTEMVSPQIIIVINGGYVVCNHAKLVTKERGTHELTLTIPIDEMTIYEKELFE